MSNNTTTTKKEDAGVVKFHRVLELYTAEDRAAMAAYLNRIELDIGIDDDELRAKLVQLKQEDRDGVRAYLNRIEDEKDGVEIELKGVFECMRATDRDETKAYLERISEVERMEESVKELKSKLNNRKLPK